MRIMDFISSLSGMAANIRKWLPAKKKEGEGYTLKGIHQHRIDIRLRIKQDEHLIKQRVRQVVLNDMWTIPGRGVDLVLTEPLEGLAKMDVTYYAVAANADSLLGKLHALDHVEQAGLTQIQAINP
jgi:hypothetical protein